MRFAALALVAGLCPAAPDARELQRQAASLLAAGELDRALQTARAAEAGARQSGDKAARSLALNTAGQVLLYRGDFDHAASDFEEAARLSSESGDFRHAADQLSNLGSARFYQGRYDEAFRNYRRAAQITEANAGQPWTSEMEQVNAVNLATLYQRIGMFQEALSRYKQAASAPRLPSAARAQLFSNLGALYRRLGDPWLAVEEYDKAIALLGEGAPSDLRLGILENRAIAEALGLRNLKAAEATLRQVLDLAEREGNARAVAQARLYLGEVYRRGNRSGDATREFELALDAARRLKAPEEEWKALAGLGRYAGAITVIESLRSGMTDSRLRSRFLSDKRDVYDLQIARRLSEGAGFDELLDLTERSRARSLSDKLVPGIAAAAQIRDRLDPSSVLISQWKYASSEAFLWCTKAGCGVAPSLDRIEALSVPAVTRILFVPDGALLEAPDLLSFRGSRLIDRFEIAVLPAASLLLRPPPESGWQPPWTPGLTGIGAPDTPGEGFGPDRGWAPLPRAAEELRVAASRVSGTARILTGSNATRANLFANAARGYVLHFATHAAADIESPDRSRILLAGESGAYLYYSEIPSLPLARTHLTVLSACETERGEEVRGEGVQSLGSAFLAAGSASVVTTLWRVDDNAAAEMMNGFYAALAKGHPKATALRLAKIRLMRSGTPLADPRHWAAFVLVGDGWSPLPRVAGWLEVFAAAALVGVTGLWWARSRRGSSR